MLWNDSTLLFPIRSGIISVLLSIILMKPGASPLGEIVGYPFSSEVAIQRKGERSINIL